MSGGAAEAAVFCHLGAKRERIEGLGFSDGLGIG